MFDAVAGWASILGFLLTILTLWAARSAAKAAKEARAEVRSGNAVEEFRHLQNLGGEFLSFLENNQIEAALVRSRDLMSAMRHASRRWSNLIPEAEGRSYGESAAQISVIATTLAARGAPENPREKQKLLRICHDVLQTISVVAGTVTAHMESREN
jgi:type II secretory pathway pseudopilin PulG